MRILRIAIRSLAASGALTLAAGCAGNGTTSPGEDSALLSGKTAQPLDATPQAVIDAVNAALPGATILEVELEDEDGRQVYDVEATDSEGVLYEVEVAADFDYGGVLGTSDSAANYSQLRYSVSIDSPAAESEIIKVLDWADAHSPWLSNMKTALTPRRAVQITSRGEAG